MGTVTEFGFSDGIGRGFGGKMNLVYLKTIGQNWNLLPSKAALTFIDNHDNQRSGNPNVLTYKTPRTYKMAVAFMLAYSYGIPRIMSSFEFTISDQGPPADSNGNLISPVINPDGTCSGGYICEHRWRQIYSMIEFKNVTNDAVVKFWWDNGVNQIAFSRYKKGFIAFNGDNYEFKESLQTSLPEGLYCDIISGSKINGTCSGRTIYVNKDGIANINIKNSDNDGVIAVHIKSRL